MHATGPCFLLHKLPIALAPRCPILLIVQYEGHMGICPDSPLSVVGVARGWPARLVLRAKVSHPESSSSVLDDP